MIDRILIGIGFAAAVLLLLAGLRGLADPLFAVILGILFAAAASLHWRSLERKRFEEPGMILTPYALEEEENHE